MWQWWYRCWRSGEGREQFCIFTPAFLVLNTGTPQSSVSGAGLSSFKNMSSVFPAISFPCGAPGERPHGRSHVRPVLRPQQRPGSLVSRLAGRGDPGPGRLFMAKKAVSNDLWSVCQTCLLVCLSLILTLAFCSWSGWNGFSFGFSSFIITLECHILWNAK